MNEPTLDVSGLPTYAFGRRDPRWVAVLLLMAIEGSVFGLVLFAYFYTRTRLEVWPPTNVGHREVAYGAVTLGLLLASVLERAEAGETILVVVIADGVETLVFRATDALADFSPAASVEQQIAWGNDSLSYHDFLTWRQMVTREPRRRSKPVAPSAPPALRTGRWKFTLTGSRCTECGAVQLPPARVCSACHALDRMTQSPVADRRAVVAAFAVDRLAESPSPPLTTAVLDFDGGGRFECEVTDLGAAALHLGDQMELTFRRLFTAEGVHNYFWKARPLRSGSSAES